MNWTASKYNELSSMWRPEGGIISTLIEACQLHLLNADKQLLCKWRYYWDISGYRQSDLVLMPVTLLLVLLFPYYIAIKITCCAHVFNCTGYLDGKYYCLNALCYFTLTFYWLCQFCGLLCRVLVFVCFLFICGNWSKLSFSANRVMLSFCHYGRYPRSLKWVWILCKHSLIG